MSNVTENEKNLVLELLLLFVAVILFTSIVFGNEPQNQFLPTNDIFLENVAPVVNIPEFESI